MDQVVKNHATIVENNQQLQVSFDEVSCFRTARTNDQYLHVCVWESTIRCRCLVVEGGTGHAFQMLTLSVPYCHVLPHICSRYEY